MSVAYAWMNREVLYLATKRTIRFALGPWGFWLIDVPMLAHFAYTSPPGRALRDGNPRLAWNLTKTWAKETKDALVIRLQANMLDNIFVELDSLSRRKFRTPRGVAAISDVAPIREVGYVSFFWGYEGSPEPPIECELLLFEMDMRVFTPGRGVRPIAPPEAPPWLASLLIGLANRTGFRWSTRPLEDSIDVAG